MGCKVFLSHNTEDKPAVKKLAEKLETAGFQTWLDEWNIIAGDPWQPAIEAALKDCGVCAVFLGPNLVGPWQNEEMQIAINRRVYDKTFRVVPILLPKTPRGKRGDVPAFLANTTWIEFRDSLDDDYQFKRLINSLRGLPTRPDKADNTELGCPYKGLETFGIGDASNFFGREALTDWLVSDVRRMQESDREPRFLAIVGASGSGKSSVARAGLLYELEQGAIPGSDQWARIIIDHPGIDPLTELFTRGANVLALQQNAIELENSFIKPIREHPEHSNKLNVQTELALADQPSKRLLIFIDQFEEIFTACQDSIIRHRFVDLLLQAARSPNGRILIVITIRLDFLSKCVDHPELAGIISGGMELVGAMTDQELEATIQQPAAKKGVDISPTLVRQLIKDVRKQPGSLPLLEHVLTKLWQQKTGNRITHEDYTLKVKGIEGALAEHADDILRHKCGEEAQQQQVLQLLTRLVHIADVATPETDTRLRYAINETEYQLVKPFVDARLLMTSNATVSGLKPQNASRKYILEVAHEALIRNWPNLQNAIKDRQFVLWRERLSIAATEWQRSKIADNLFDGQKLIDAKQWLKEKKGELNSQEISFINNSAWRPRYRTAKISLLIIIPLALISWFFMWSALNFTSPSIGLNVLLTKVGIQSAFIPKMVRIPKDGHCTLQDPCTFTMGSPDSDQSAQSNEKLAHSVVFTQPFYLSQTEVTFDQFELYAYFIKQEGGCQNQEIDGKPHTLSERNDSGFGTGQHPVINVDWYDAECIGLWLSQQTGKRYRLPSEAEWEYAARAGATGVYYWKDEEKPGDFAWFRESSDRKTHAVGGLKPNAFSLYDMAGNVWEWVLDDFHENYDHAPSDGKAWISRSKNEYSHRVLRGGSWFDEAGSLRSAARGWSYPAERSTDLGFRLAQD